MEQTPKIEPQAIYKFTDAGVPAYLIAPGTRISTDSGEYNATVTASLFTEDALVVQYVTDEGREGYHCHAVTVTGYTAGAGSSGTPNVDALRYRTFGLYDAEAAADLYIDSGLAVRLGIPPDGEVDLPELLAQRGGVLSGAERRLLAICASLADPQVQVNLSDITSSLDQRNQQLVLRAMAHAMGQRPADWTRPERPEGWS